MPCHAPLNHSGGNRLGCVALHPLLPCRARRTGRYLRGARKTEPAKPVLPCQGPFCFYRPRAVRRSSPVCITASSVFVRATRSEHQRSRERHIARCNDGAQEQNEVVLCRNCGGRGFAVDGVGNRGRNCKSEPQRTQRSQRKKKGRERSRPVFPICVDPRRGRLLVADSVHERA